MKKLFKDSKGVIHGVRPDGEYEVIRKSRSEIRDEAGSKSEIRDEAGSKSEDSESDDN